MNEAVAVATVNKEAKAKRRVERIGCGMGEAERLPQCRSSVVVVRKP